MLGVMKYLSSGRLAHPSRAFRPTSERIERENERNTERQLKIILNGIDDESYECLTNRTGGKYIDVDTPKSRMCLPELRHPKNPYIDYDINDENRF